MRTSIIDRGAGLEQFDREGFVIFRDVTDPGFWLPARSIATAEHPFTRVWASGQQLATRVAVSDSWHASRRTESSCCGLPSIRQSFTRVLHRPALVVSPSQL